MFHVCFHYTGLLGIGTVSELIFFNFEKFISHWLILRFIIITNYFRILFHVLNSGSVSARLSYNGSRVVGSVNHTETMELSLAQETAQSWPSFGIVLSKQQNELDGEEELEGGEGLSLVVGHIERGSPADKLVNSLFFRGMHGMGLR